MSGRGAVSGCRRTAWIAATLLDGGTLGGADLVHVAGCAACTRESDRVSRFEGRLALAAQAAMDEVPEPRRTLGRIPRLVVPGAMFAGATAAGLLVAAVVGLRITPPVEPASGFSSAATVQERLAALDIDLVCQPAAGGVSCESRAANHRHRVVLVERDGAIDGVEGGIVGTTGDPIDLTGADDLLRRIAVAALEGPSEAAVTSWIAATYPGCTGTCTTGVAGLNVTLEVRNDAAILRVEAR